MYIYKNNYRRHFNRYSKRKPLKTVTFDHFWAAIQRIQSKQTLNKLLDASRSTSYLNQSYSLPSTIIDYLIKSCTTQFLFNLSKACKELTYFTRKLCGRAVGYLIVKDNNCKANLELGITTCVDKIELKNDVMLICNYESSRFLKNVVCENILEIHCPKKQGLLNEKLSTVLHSIKKLQHKVLIVLTGNDQLTEILDDHHCSLLFHENLTEIDMITNIVPLKYLPLLKNCQSFRLAINFKECINETKEVFSTWKPFQKFKKFVVRVENGFISEAFINFITNFMATDSIFAITVPVDTDFDNHNIRAEGEDNEILHSIFCKHFDNLPRNCYTTISEFTNHNQTADHCYYQVTFRDAQFCNDIFAPKNCFSLHPFKWDCICSTSKML